jgi:sulfatase modifying factor 1
MVKTWADVHRADQYGPWAETRIGTTALRWCWCPSGHFQMGSPESEEGRWDDEGPEHEVRFTRGFWIADTPCTQALWTEVMGSNPSHFKGDQRPVENVSWHDVQEFLRRLAERRPQLQPRLPTEAQWEYACRAGTTGARYGDLGEIAWHHGNSGGETHPVGEKAPNPWGLYDTLGNVLEWCADGRRNYVHGAATDPVGPPPERWAAVRGGSWRYGARFVRAAPRYANGPSCRDSNLGFRLARG